MCYIYLSNYIYLSDLFITERKRVVFVFLLSLQHIEGLLLFLCNSCLAFQATHIVHVSGPKIPVHFQQAVYPAKQTVNVIHLSF